MWAFNLGLKPLSVFCESLEAIKMHMCIYQHWNEYSGKHLNIKLYLECITNEYHDQSEEHITNPNMCTLESLLSGKCGSKMAHIFETACNIEGSQT